MTVPPFDRTFLGGRERFTRIGGGSVGGKAAGLLFIKDVLADLGPGQVSSRVEIEIPTLTVIAVDEFDRFMTLNRLHDVALSTEPDDRIALAFQRAELPPPLVGDLRALIEQVHTPLAIRSSSLLEDALREPFAGMYATKMIPNNQPDADTRFRRLVDAIKFVYASTYFAEARAYRRATGRGERDEKMAVIIQEVVGRRHEDRFYPDVAGVARSYSFYPIGGARREAGVVSLALGLGRTIVDDGVAWSYSPARPAVRPPFGSIDELLERTQTRFWAVNMGRPPAYDPLRETEYLVQPPMQTAEADGTLAEAASTYDPVSDRLWPGVDRRGPRVVDFAPILAGHTWPLNDAVRQILTASERALEAQVEIEFAATFDRARDMARLGFLQVRPMSVPAGVVTVADEVLQRPDVLVASSSVLGNGIVRDIHDVVYVRPDAFERRHMSLLATEIDAINRRLVADERPYLLIGFGRWGSSDPWLGIPVGWAQLAGARVIVEACLPHVPVEPSEGSHLFHNLASLGVSYFTVKPEDRPIAWDWLDQQPIVADRPLVRHVRTESPLLVAVDGRSGRGVILTGPSDQGIFQ